MPGALVIPLFGPRFGEAVAAGDVGGEAVASFNLVQFVARRDLAEAVCEASEAWS